MHGVPVVRRFLKGGADFCSRGKVSEQLFSVENFKFGEVKFG